MKHNIIKYSLLVVAFGLFSCGGDAVPKPKGHLRLEYPEAVYEKFEPNCAYGFEVNKAGEINILFPVKNCKYLT